MFTKPLLAAATVLAATTLMAADEAPAKEMPKDNAPQPVVCPMPGRHMMDSERPMHHRGNFAPREGMHNRHMMAREGRMMMRQGTMPGRPEKMMPKRQSSRIGEAEMLLQYDRMKMADLKKKYFESKSDEDLSALKTFMGERADKFWAVRKAGLEKREAQLTKELERVKDAQKKLEERTADKEKFIQARIDKWLEMEKNKVEKSVDEKK